MKLFCRNTGFKVASSNKEKKSFKAGTYALSCYNREECSKYANTANATEGLFWTVINNFGKSGFFLAQSRIMVKS